MATKIKISTGVRGLVPSLGGAVVTNFNIVNRENIIAQYGEEVDRAVYQRLFRLGQKIRDYARNLAPVDTGAMKASIYVTRDGTVKQQDAGYLRAINTSVRRRTKAIDLLGKRRQRLHLRKEGLDNFRRQLPTGYGSKKLDKRAFRKQHFRPTVDATTTGIDAFSVYYVYIGVAAYYAGYVEFGHHSNGNFIPAQPFLGPAMEWGRMQLPHEIEEAFRNGN